MPADPRAAVRTAALGLLRALAGATDVPAVRVAEAEGGLACIIQLWDATRVMPTARAERGGRRSGCRDDLMALVRASDRPLTRKELVKALRETGKPHGPGTVAKALAELTRGKELVNPNDKRGYRLPGWQRRDHTPSLFG